MCPKMCDAFFLKILFLTLQSINFLNIFAWFLSYGLSFALPKKFLGHGTLPFNILIYLCMYFCIMYFWVANFSVYVFMYRCNFCLFSILYFLLFRYFVRFLLCGLSLSPSQKIFRVRELSLSTS